MKKTYVTIDTNVVISYLLSRNPNSAVTKVIMAVENKVITPLLHEKIYAEYWDVARREKFHFEYRPVRDLLRSISHFAEYVKPIECDENFAHESDRIFYEVTLAKENSGAKLATGNIKHFPSKSFVVTPAELVDTLGL